MCKYEDIKSIIKSKIKDIDELSLTYFTNYFYILATEKILTNNIKIEDLINKGLAFAEKVEFYDQGHWVYKEYGGDIKGVARSDLKTIFIKNNLGDPLREIIFYHELHHAVQTNLDTGNIGINQDNYIGGLILEAQTQYFAERVYSKIHNVEFQKRKITSDKLRMCDNGIVVSCLHNYEMYDNLLSKLALLLNVPKDYFVSINFLYENDEGLINLQQKYNEIKEKYDLEYDFYQILFILDYIYFVDYWSYLDNPEKETLLNGGETVNYYGIRENKAMKLSQAMQRQYIVLFDKIVFDLLRKTGNYSEFIEYIIDNDLRKQIEELLSKEKNDSNSSKK